MWMTTTASRLSPAPPTTATALCLNIHSRAIGRITFIFRIMQFGGPPRRWCRAGVFFTAYPYGKIIFLLRIIQELYVYAENQTGHGYRSQYPMSPTQGKYDAGTGRRPITANGNWNLQIFWWAFMIWPIRPRQARGFPALLYVFIQKEWSNNKNYDCIYQMANCE